MAPHAEMGDGFAPVEKQKTYELVAEHLIAMIGNRRLRPGEPLPTEKELATRFRVGRSSVREALRMLESKGLIRSLGKGSFVVAPSLNPLSESLLLLFTLREATMRELFEVRKLLEVQTVALAAERRTRADLKRMEQAIREMDEGIGSPHRYIAADLQFHLAIAEATKNRIVARLMHAIRGLLQRALFTIYDIPGSPQRSLEQHRQIFAAIERKDAAEARVRMVEHLSRVEHDIRNILGGKAWEQYIRPLEDLDS